MEPTGRQDPRRPTVALLAILAVAASAAVYRSLPATYFYADDFVCLLQIRDQGFVRFALSVFGGHILLVRNLVFYATHAVFGFDSAPYYWTAFLTHLVNVWLLFRVAYGFTNDAPIACLGATMWGTSPLCVGALGWYSVYGQVLVATILLAVLADLAPARAVSARRATAWAVLLVAGTMCFGVGIGIALVFPLVIALLAPGALRDRRVLAGTLAFAPAVVGLYFAYRWVAGLVEPLSMGERIVVGIGLRNPASFFALFPHLLGYGTSGLLLGFFFTRYLGVASELVLAGSALAVLVVAVTADATTRRRLVALLLLAFAAYAIIAVGRAQFLMGLHLDVSAAAGQLRYHYAALVPLAVVVCLVLDRLRRAIRVPGVAFLAAWFALATYGYTHSRWALDLREPYRYYAERVLRTIDGMIDRQPEGTEVRIPNQLLAPGILGTVLRPVDFPGWAGLFVLRYPENVVRGRRVRFIERDPAILRELHSPEKHRRLHDLVVAEPAA